MHANVRFDVPCDDVISTQQRGNNHDTLEIIGYDRVSIHTEYDRFL